MSELPSANGLLIVPHVRVQNANASGGYAEVLLRDVNGGANLRTQVLRCVQGELICATLNDAENAATERWRMNSGGAMRFGMGPHICIGMHLARLEITRAMTAILDNLPNLRLDPSMPPPVQQGSELRSPQHLHVLFDPPSSPGN
jgi:hypothetical protein